MGARRRANKIYASHKYGRSSNKTFTGEVAPLEFEETREERLQRLRLALWQCRHAEVPRVDTVLGDLRFEGIRVNFQSIMHIRLNESTNAEAREYVGDERWLDRLRTRRAHRS